MSESLAVERYREAMNAHDLERLVDCFDAEYESVQPLKPGASALGK